MGKIWGQDRIEKESSGQWGYGMRSTNFDNINTDVFDAYVNLLRDERRGNMVDI